MTAKSTHRGHAIEYNIRENVWQYVENRQILCDKKPCKKCGNPPTVDGYDFCIGEIKGATSACCGHGVTDAYAIFEVKQ